MEIKFFTENGVLDLSAQKISFQESNSKLSDKMLTKFTFPFEVYIDEYFIHSFGDYASHENTLLKKHINGKLLFEGRVYDAILEVMSIEGKYLTGQIDFGFDEIPNFSKKLSELPLEKFEVEDIHQFAIETCKKKYPETNFNFPRIHTTKYNPTDTMWDAFEGYYNHTILRNGVLEMAKNVYPSEKNNWTIDNVNIIHPCPHILYLLKTGFGDAGFSLAGDILTDTNLAQRWVFSGGQYFRNKWIVAETFIISKDEYSDSSEDEVRDHNDEYMYTNYDYYFNKKFILAKKDKYRLDFNFPTSNFWAVNIEVKHKNRTIHKHYYVLDRNFSLFLTTQQDNEEIEVEFSYHGRGPLNNEKEVLRLKARSMNGYLDQPNDAEETKIVENENHIDLTRAVPDFTFGELVNIVKTWFNYDLKIVEKTVYMNFIGTEELSPPKDFRAFEVSSPKRVLLTEKSFLLKFVELDNGYKLDSLYYDKNGFKLNGKENKETSVIEINGYAMPVAKAKEYHTPTAQVKKDSDDVLALVYYDGLVDGINNAQNPPGCAFPELFHNNWEKWLRQRLKNEEYQWNFIADIEDISAFTMNDNLFCYQKRHIIKTINKDMISPTIYEVEITTEASI